MEALEAVPTNSVIQQLRRRSTIKIHRLGTITAHKSLLSNFQSNTRQHCHEMRIRSLKCILDSILRVDDGEKDRTSRTIITIIVVASAAVMISIISISILIIRVKKCRQEIEQILNSKSLQFNISTMKFTTDNFSDANKRG
ncbi:hypothetical protein LWI29_005774 [Acer saccharum]|uniref:Uncharacterized protein n=1 Tax=Acer saccharum TaxID=4024 RepID=A0AA39VGX1_ACESA|nr:hypothetical protein LWI29_005774 [Acer saccharum]